MAVAQRTFVKAGENYMGQIGFNADVIPVTVTLDTSAYASADLIADTQEIAGAMRAAGGKALLDSIVILDEDDQGVALTVVLTQVSTSFGTENSAPNISDANLATVQGHVAFATTDYIDVGTAKVGTRSNLGLLVESAADSSSLYFAIVNGAGTPTFTATGMKIKFGFRRL